MSLQLSRIRIEQLRRFRQALELTGLAPGLNVLAGPNEAGKSTVVRAIRAAFFERHRSTAVEDLRPWGEGGTATPTVALDFVLNGMPHRLVKSFLGKKRCTLQIGERTLDGVDAEDHLAQQLGFAFAAKGASKPEHWGIPGLLWVEQGQGQDLDVGHAKHHLHHALQGQAGDSAAELAATAGDELLAQLRGQRAELLSATGKPRGALDEALNQLAASEASCRDLDTQLSQYRQQVDELAGLRQQWARDERDRPWEPLRVALAQTQARQQALQQQEQQWQQDQARLAQLAQTRQLLEAQLQAHAQAGAALAQREQALKDAQVRLRLAEAAVAQAQPQLVAAQARLQAAQHASRLARQADQRTNLQQQLAEAERQLQQSQVALARAQQAQDALLAWRSHPDARTVSEAVLKSLRQLERQCRDAELRHQAVATQLVYRLAPGQQLLHQGPEGGQGALSGEGSLLLDAPTTLILPGLGELTVNPGGQDLANLGAQLLKARDALQAALQAQGLPDLAEAETRLARHQAWRQQCQLAEQAVALVAPQGVEQLALQRANAQARRDTLRDAVAALPPTAPEQHPAQEPLAALEAQEATARQQEQAAQSALAQARAQQAAAASQVEQAHREQVAAQAALQDPQRQQQHAMVQQQWLSSGDEHVALSARISQTAQALRDARPDIVAQDLQRLQRSIDQQVMAHQQRREQLLVLESQLQQASALNLDEQRDAAAGALSRTRQRADELQRRAAALDLLCSRLDAMRQATIERLQAPLQQRLQHYLPLLMPGAAVRIDAQLAPGSLLRPASGGLSEAADVDALSFGAREQLRLITRFAYADLLQQAGQPTLLILDDALVHSDAMRLVQMKRVLFDVAQRHQLLLFTCHPEQWQDMGVAVRTLG